MPVLFPYTPYLPVPFVVPTTPCPSAASPRTATASERVTLLPFPCFPSRATVPPALLVLFACKPTPVELLITPPDVSSTVISPWQTGPPAIPFFVLTQ